MIKEKVSKNKKKTIILIIIGIILVVSLGITLMVVLLPCKIHSIPDGEYMYSGEDNTYRILSDDNWSEHYWRIKGNNAYNYVSGSSDKYEIIVAEDKMYFERRVGNYVDTYVVTYDESTKIMTVNKQSNISS